MKQRKSADAANYQFYCNWALARFNMIENIGEECLRWAEEDACITEQTVQVQLAQKIV